MPARRKEPRWIEDENGCWIWQLSVSKKGYGKVKDQGRTRAAHTVVYEQMVGPAPEGLEPDHTCRVRACVRPDHLEWVTHKVNMERAEFAQSKRTECPAGHAYDETNTRVHRGRRHCRACGPRHKKRSMQRRRDLSNA
jgi:hypothetical protein